VAEWFIAAVFKTVGAGPEKLPRGFESYRLRQFCGASTIIRDAPFFFYFLFQRVSAAFRAISARRSAVVKRARASPPLRPRAFGAARARVKPINFQTETLPKVAALLPDRWRQTQRRFEMAASGGFWQKSALAISRKGERAMQVGETAIPAVKIVTPKKHGDARGFFSEVYNRSDWDKASLEFTFVQDNHSLSAAMGTLRGLHFQTPPFAQDKLVRCARGRILDVAVDIRRLSPTFGQYVAVELSAENWRQMLIPIGFAHAFITLEPDVEVLYKTTAPYSAAHDRGVAWDDPAIGIAWPSLPGGPVLSDKDRRLPRLKDAPELFE
jgi:dTDP-4-dehydrorhamnose 3,5-epimerase